jgi:hypothetical protein
MKEPGDQEQGQEYDCWWRAEHFSVSPVSLIVDLNGFHLKMVPKFHLCGDALPVLKCGNFLTFKVIGHLQQQYTWSLKHMLPIIHLQLLTKSASALEQF